LLDACEYCAAPENHDEVIATLARPEYVDTPATVLRRGLIGPFDFGRGNARAVQDFCVFHGHDANEPSADKAARVFELVRDSGLCPDPSALTFALGRRVYRQDIYQKAVRQRDAKVQDHPAPPSTEPEGPQNSTELWTALTPLKS
jgi:two-component system, oxyanion-binding sensor